ncbi:hypothetical protein BB560_000418 [Smittium megazygosporum]|uniref:Uncharacterized protein n=1 Tax=Smittium megazygosporum TaxID=133381 RepID=A0A2T9ZKC1_9FUNG|nr:hypothetical protein BB560_000418 [Smittium megazygosporum]
MSIINSQETYKFPDSNLSISALSSDFENTGIKIENINEYARKVQSSLIPTEEIHVSETSAKCYNTALEEKKRTKSKGTVIPSNIAETNHLIKLSTTNLQGNDRQLQQKQKRKKKEVSIRKVYPMRKRTEIALHPFTKFQWTKLEDVPMFMRSRIDTSILQEPIDLKKKNFSLRKSRFQGSDNESGAFEADNQDFDLLDNLSLSSENKDQGSYTSSRLVLDGNTPISPTSFTRNRQHAVINIEPNLRKLRRMGPIDKKLHEWVLSINQDLSSSEFAASDANPVSSIKSPMKEKKLKIQYRSRSKNKKAKDKLHRKDSLQSLESSDDSLGFINKKGRTLKIVPSTSSAQDSSSSSISIPNRKVNKRNRITADSIRGVLPASFLRTVNKDDQTYSAKIAKRKSNASISPARIEKNKNYRKAVSISDSEKSSLSMNQFRQDVASPQNSYNISHKENVRMLRKSRHSSKGDIFRSRNTLDEHTRYMGQVTFLDIYDWQYPNPQTAYKQAPLFLRVAKRELLKKHRSNPNLVNDYDDPDIKVISFDHDPLIEKMQFRGSGKDKRKFNPQQKSEIISSYKNEDIGFEVLEIWKTRMLDVRRICFPKKGDSYSTISSSSADASSYSYESKLEKNKLLFKRLKSSRKLPQTKERTDLPNSAKSRMFGHLRSMRSNISPRSYPRKLGKSNRSPSMISYTRYNINNQPIKQTNLHDWRTNSNNGLSEYMHKPSNAEKGILLQRKSIERQLEKGVDKISNSLLEKSISAYQEDISQSENYTFNIYNVYKNLFLFKTGLYLQNSNLLNTKDPLEFPLFLASIVHSTNFSLVESLFPTFKPYHFSINEGFQSLTDIKNKINDQTSLEDLMNTFNLWIDYNLYIATDTSKTSFDPIEEVLFFKWHTVVILCVLKCICIKFALSEMSSASIGPKPVTMAVGPSSFDYKNEIALLDHEVTHVLSEKILEYSKFLLERVDTNSMRFFKLQESGEGISLTLSMDFLVTLTTWFGVGDGFVFMIFSKGIGELFRKFDYQSLPVKEMDINSEFRKCINSSLFQLDSCLAGYLKLFNSVPIKNGISKHSAFNINLWEIISSSLSLPFKINPKKVLFNDESGFINDLLFIEENSLQLFNTLLPLSQFSLTGISSSLAPSTKFYVVIECVVKMAISLYISRFTEQHEVPLVFLDWQNCFLKIVHKLVCCQISVEVNINTKLLYYLKEMYDRLSKSQKKQNYSLMMLQTNKPDMFCCSTKSSSNIQWKILQIYGTLFDRWNTAFKSLNVGNPAKNKFKKEYKMLISKLLPTGGYNSTDVLDYNKLSSDYSLLLVILLRSNDSIISPQRLTTQILGLSGKLINSERIVTDYEFWKLTIASWSILGGSLFKLLDETDNKLLGNESKENETLKMASMLFDTVRLVIAAWDKYLFVVYNNYVLEKKKLVLENVILKIIQSAYALVDLSTFRNNQISKTRVLGSIYLFLCSACFQSVCSGHTQWPAKSDKRALWFLELLVKLNQSTVVELAQAPNQTEFLSAENETDGILNDSLDSLFLDFGLDDDKLNELIKVAETAEMNSNKNKRLKSAKKQISLMYDKKWIPLMRTAIIEQSYNRNHKDYTVLIKRVKILAIMISSCVPEGVRNWDSFMYVYGNESLDVIQNNFMRRVVKIFFLKQAVSSMSEQDLIRLKEEIVEWWFYFLVDMNIQQYLEEISISIESKLIEFENLNKDGRRVDYFPFYLVVNLKNSNYSEILNEEKGTDVGTRENINNYDENSIFNGKYNFELLEGKGVKFINC